MNFFVTLLAAATASWVFFKFKIPGAVMIGALTGALTLNVLTDLAYMPQCAKFAAQIMAGAFIGCSFSRDDIKRLPTIAKPLTVIIAAFFILNMVLGFWIYYTTPLDLLTALMATVPAGMSDTPIIAAEIGADAGKVTILQFVRLVAGLAIFPSMISTYDRHACRVSPEGLCETTAHISDKSKMITLHPRIAVLITLATAITGGLFGQAINMPAGGLTMSMIAVIVLKLKTGIGQFPPLARRLTQLLSGAYIGCGMNAGDLAEMRFLVIPMAVILIGYTINCFVVGYILHRYFHMERKVAMLSVTPAGARDMALISADIGVFSTDLVVIQILRMILVISIFPQIILMIVRFAGG